MPIFADRVKEYSTTAGTSAYALAGASQGFRSFSSALSNGDTCFYAAADGVRWEVGVGTYNGGTLARTVVLASSNANAAVDWPAASKQVWIDDPAAAIRQPAVMDTIADAEASFLDNVQDLIVQRWAAGSKPAPQPYKRAAAQPAHAGAFQSADGIWFEYAGHEVDAYAMGAVGDGVTSDVTALRQACSVANALGVPVRLPTGRFLCDAAIISAGTYSGFDMRGDGPLKSVILHAADGAPMFQFIGQTLGISAGLQLTAVAAARSNVLSVATATLTAGQFIIVQDPSQPVISPQTGLMVCDTGEVCQIKEVLDGSSLTLWGGLTFDYTTAAKVRPYTLLIDGFTLRGVGISNTNPGGSSQNTMGVSLFRAHDITIEDCHFDALDDDAIRLDNPIDANIGGNTFNHLNNPSGFTPYSLNIANGGVNIRFHDNMQRGGRHMFTCGASTGAIEAGAGSMVIGNIAEGMMEAGLDTHPGSRDVMFIGNRVDKGDIADDNLPGSCMQIRGRRHKVIGNSLNGGEYGISVVFAGDVVVENNTIRNVAIGIGITKAADVKLHGNNIYDAADSGVYVTDGGAASMPGLVMDGNKVFGSPTVAAYNFEHWEDNFIVHTNLAPDAAIPYAGPIPNAVAYGVQTYSGAAPAVQAVAHAALLSPSTGVMAPALPSSTLHRGLALGLSNVGASFNAVVAPSSGNLINGSTSLTLTPGQTAALVSDGANWFSV